MIVAVTWPVTAAESSKHCLRPSRKGPVVTRAGAGRSGMGSGSGLADGALTPENAVIYICGLNGTIANTLERLLPRGFVPNHRKIRRALQVPDDVAPSFFFEPYDNTPVVDIKSEENCARLRALMASGA